MKEKRMKGKKINYCARCVNISTRPDGTDFDEEGMCAACRHSLNRQKFGIDFDARRRELDKIVEWGKQNSKSSYDCIVTISGGKDSTRQAFYARDELGLKPLLVSSVYPAEQQTELGARNLSNLVEHGFDTVCIGVDPQVAKTLTRETFRNFGNLVKATEYALYAIPIHAAIAYKVPLIFLGENPLYTIGQKEGDTDGGDASGMKYSNSLQGGNADDLLPDDVSRQNACLYQYPSDADIDYAKLRIVYLGYYIPDWSEMNNARFAMERGLGTRDADPEKTGQLYDFTCLDEDFYVVNQMLKYIKFGFGATTDQVCGAINQGLMTRKEGFELVKKYDGNCHSSYIRRFCNYIQISEEDFWRVAEQYRNKDLFYKDENGEWQLDTVYPELE